MFSYYLSSYLLSLSYSLNILIMLLIKNLSNHDNMVILVYHFTVDMHMNMQRCLLGPYLSYHGLLFLNLLRNSIMDCSNNVSGIVYDGYINDLDRDSRLRHLHSMND